MGPRLPQDARNVVELHSWKGRWKKPPQSELFALLLHEAGIGDDGAIAQLTAAAVSLGLRLVSWP
jgi:hypothetical protein